LEIDASAMDLEANKLADKAESTPQLAKTLLAKSNALRRGCCEQTNRNERDGRRHS